MDYTPNAEQATARCRATDKTLHQRRAQPCAADARKKGVGRAGREAGAGCEGTAGTRRSSLPRPHQRRAQRAAREFRVARDFAPAGRV